MHLALKRPVTRLASRVALALSVIAAILLAIAALVPSVALASGDHVHDWGDWEVVEEQSYLDDGTRRRVCQSDPSHIDEETIPAFGPVETQREEALAGDGEYGDGVSVRLLYTRPYVLSHKTQADEDGKIYQSVPIGLDNPVARGHDIAIRYTGDAPTLAVMYMGKGTNLWKGWTTKYADATVDLSDGSGQHVALYSWRATDDKWGRVLDTWKQSQLDESGSMPSFDSICLTVASGQECHLVEVASLSDEPRVTPTMRDESADKLVPAALLEMWAGYNLSGHMEANWESPDGPARDGGWGRSDLELEAHWSRGTYIDRQTIHDIRERGFRAIRLPVSWFQHIYEFDGNPYHIDRAWMQRVHEVVDWCLAEDLYVIVNTHHEAWLERATLGSDYDEISPELIAIWQQIADEFAGYDQRLVFEGMNEPHSIGASGFGTPTEDEIRTVEKLNEDFVDTIRRIGRENPSSRHLSRIIMVTAYAGTGDVIQDRFSNWMMGYSSSDMLVVSAHSYAPHSFTHFGNDLTLEETVPLWPQNAYTAAYRDSQDRTFHRLRRCYTNRGIPVILGEFGSFYCGEDRQADRLAWMETHVTYLKRLGIPGFIWGMDRTWSETNQKAWNVYDEDTHEWSEQSEAMIDRWFEILYGDIRWGCDAEASDDEHMPLDDGIALKADGTVSLERTDGNDDTRRIRLTPQPGSGLPEWKSSNRDDGTIADAIGEDKEIAVRFDGDIPYLWLCSVNDAGWRNWQKLEPRDVIDGVAYWPCDSLIHMWEEREDETSQEEPKARRGINQLTIVFVATDGMTTVSDARLLDVHDHGWGVWATTQSPTCDSPGARARTCDGLPRHVESQAIDALGHDWGERSYVWDGTSCSATCDCQRCGKHASETSVATRSETMPATTDAEGLATLTAEFSGEPFTAQEKTVPIPRIPGGSGSGSGSGSGGGGNAGDAGDGQQSGSVFIDVNGKTPHEQDILSIAARGITTGWKLSDGRREFRPTGHVVRQDMAAFLFRMAKAWGVAGATDGWTASPEQMRAFKDVTESTPHCQEIWWLASVGVSKGWLRADGTREFRPIDTVKRQDMAAFLFRLAELAGKGGAKDGWKPGDAAKGRFSDVGDATSHHDEIWWLAETGISKGWQVGDKYEFRGMEPIKRQDMAAFIRRELDLT